MEGIAAEVGQKLKSAIKAKLMELGVYVDEELPNYVMVMVTNRRSKSEMDKELQLFLGDHTNEFTTWLQSVWTKLEQVTVSTSDYSSKRKFHEDKKKKKKKRSERGSTEERKMKKDRRSSSATDISDLPIKVEKEDKVSSIDDKSGVIEHEKHKNEIRSGHKEKENIENLELKSKAKVETESVTESIKKHEPTSPRKTGVTGDSGGEEEDFLNIRDDTEAELFSCNEETIENDAGKNIEKQQVKHKRDVDEIAKNNIELKDDENSRKVRRDLEENKRRPTDGRHMSKLNVEEERDRKVREVEPRRESGHRRLNRISAYERLGARSSTDRTRKNRIRSRSRSRSRSIHKSRSRSLSPARRLRSNRDPKLLEDARELINRKRGKHTTDESSETNRRVLVRPDTERRVLNSDTTKDKESRYRRVTDRFNDKESSSKYDDGRGSRLVLDGRNRGEDRIEPSDRRPLKRRNSEQDSDEDELTNNNVKNSYVVNKSRDKLDAVSSVAVPVKIPTRPKVPAEKSATGNLIRRAVAEAHKSLLSNIRPDHVKKLDSMSSRSGGKFSNKVPNKKVKETSDSEHSVIDDRMTESVVEYTEDSNDIDDPSKKTINEKELPDEVNWTKKIEEDEVEEVVEITMENITVDDAAKDSEEMVVDTSETQFVVTLTGIDPNLYPVSSTSDNIDEEMVEVISFTAPPSKLNGVKSKDKCKFWPNCLSGDSCAFYHPTTPCKMFPSCKFGSACLYIHPNCKFDASCTRYDCPFVHTSPRPASSFYNGTRTQVASSTQQCRYYPNCTNVACPFQHSFQKVCRYDRNCTNNYCPYTHSSFGRVTIAPIEKLKWSRPATPPPNTMEAETTTELTVD